VIVSLVVRENGDHRLLLAVPPLAVAVNFLWAVENRQVGLIGEYIRTCLWPYLAQTDDTLPSWEREVAKRRQGLGNVLRSTFTDFAMTVVFAGAAITSLLRSSGGGFNKPAQRVATHLSPPVLCQETGRWPSRTSSLSRRWRISRNLTWPRLAVRPNAGGARNGLRSSAARRG
jgi:hypothetical protein